MRLNYMSLTYEKNHLKICDCWKFRISLHIFNINIPRNSKDTKPTSATCAHCTFADIEDGFHALIVCGRYTS